MPVHTETRFSQSPKPSALTRLFPFYFLSMILLFFVSARGVGYPIVSFMTSPVGRFDDYLNPLVYAPLLFQEHIGVGFTPIQVFVYSLLGSLSPVNGLILSTVISLVIFSVSLKRLSKSISFSLFSVFLYPTLFAISRGNNDIWVACLLALYLSFLQSRSNPVFYVFPLALATAIDPLVLIFATLMIRAGMLRVLGLYGFLVACLYLIPILLYGASPIYELILLFQQYVEYRDGMVNEDGGLLFSNSLQAFFKGIYYIATGAKLSPEAISLIGLISLAIVFTLLIIALAKYTVGDLDFASFTMVITIVFILITSASPDYKLMFLIAPMALFFRQRNHFQKLLAFLSIVILLPKHTIWFQYEFNPVGFTSNTLINPFLLVFMMALILLRNESQVAGNQALALSRD